jgi:asparagine synthase (glutamine-hydrolysing)
MCGIAGVVDFDRRVEQPLLERMCQVMEHRGPHAFGTHVDGPAGIGMRRLAIIDVAGGDQPIFSEDGRVAVVMNGEIYNHLELRDALAAKGHRFATRADTEVLVHLYEEYGVDMVDHLRGMFAFAIWDRAARRLLCARDRVGKKPLFWSLKGTRITFASEMRALLQDRDVSREIDPGAIDAYLALQYVPDPMSAFADVQKLPPASVLTFDADGPRVRRYWQLDYSDRAEGASDEEHAEELRRQLRDATRIRLMSEVPLGAFLSGGIDSSAVVGAMAETSSGRVKTFSIGFPEREWDETEYARMVARHFDTEHHEFRVEADALGIMPTLARHYGEPYADPSAIPSFYLAQLTSQHVTVALNGDGGDESFGGYGRYARAETLGRFEQLPPRLRNALARGIRALPAGGGERSVRSRAHRLAAALTSDACARYSTSLTAFDAQRRDELLTPEFRSRLGAATGESVLRRAWNEVEAPSALERLLGVDVETYLPGDLLVKMDIATMAYSVEARSPFLDHRLMEWAAGLPARLKLADGDGKRLMKMAFRGWLPDEVLDRRKMGFGVPLTRWFRQELRDLPADLLLDPATVSRGWFRREAVERMIREHQSGTADHALRIWVLAQLETWYREVVEAPLATTSAVG